MMRNLLRNISLVVALLMVTGNAWAAVQYEWVERFNGTTIFDNDDLKKITNGEYTNNVRFSISGVSYNDGSVNKWLAYSQLDRYGSATSTFSWSVKENTNNPYAIALSKIQCNIRGYQATALLEAANAYFEGNSPVDYNTNGTGEGSSKVISTTTGLSGSSTTLYMSCQKRKTTFTLHNIQYTYRVTQRVPKFQYKAVAIADPEDGGNVYASFTNGSFSSATATTTSYSGDVLSTSTGMTKTAYFKAEAKTGYNFVGWARSKDATEYISTSLTYSETITSTSNDDANPTTLTLYAIFKSKNQPLISGSDIGNIKVDETYTTDYSFTHTITTKPSADENADFYFTILHSPDESSKAGSPDASKVISYNPETNVITALNSGSATITFTHKETANYFEESASYTITVIKYTPSFTWNTNNTPYYYGTNIPNIFSTTNDDSACPVTFESDNEAFAKVENNTLYIANLNEIANITVTQEENYKWYGQQAVYPIAPVNGNKHVPFTITNANYNLLKYSTKGSVSWSDNKVRFQQGGFNWDDSYYDIQFEGIPDKLTFDYDAQDGASGLEWFVRESSNGTDWESIENGSSSSNSGSISVTLQSSTRYLRFCYSGNLNGYISNIKVTERSQFEAMPKALDFGTNGINHGQQEEMVTFLHANAGRITTATITGADADYFSVSPTTIPGTGRDLYGTTTLKVTFDNKGQNRGTDPYNATLTIKDNAGRQIDIPLTGVRDGKSTPVFVWNPNALPYYFSTTIANVAYSSNTDYTKCPLTFTSSNESIAKVVDGDLIINSTGQEVTITVSQAGNDDHLEHTESFTFTPCERPSLEVPFRVDYSRHATSVQLGTKCKWGDNSQIVIADYLLDGFLWGDERKRAVITFAGQPDKLYFEYSSSDAATPENAVNGWKVEESPNGVDWTTAWKTGSLSASWKASGEIALKPTTQYIRFSYSGNFAGYLRNIIISSFEGHNYLRAEEGTYLSRGSKYGTQAVVDPFGVACRVSCFTVDNTNIYTRFLFVDNMQYLWETHDTKELFTDDATAANNNNLWQIPDANGKFYIQSGNDLGNKGQYVTIVNNALTFTSDQSAATIWHMETAQEHDIVLKDYMDKAAAQAAEKDFGADINTLDKVRSSIQKEDFEITQVKVPTVALTEQSGEYRDGENGTLSAYDHTISDLEPGFYRLTIKALYRISASEYAQAARDNSLESVVAYVYANDVKYPIQSVYTSYNASSYDTSDEVYNGMYYPTQLSSVEAAFTDPNRYLNDVYVYVKADEGSTTGTLHYGIKNPSFVPGAWLAYSTITLTRFGRKAFIFDGEGESGNATDWNKPDNWNRDTVPNQYHNVIIKADVDITKPVEIHTLEISQGKKVNITSTGGLTIGGGIKGAASDGSSIVIENNKEGVGFLRIQPKATNIPERVTVEYTTKALDEGKVNYEVWQYMGMPGNNGKIDNLSGVTMYHWLETSGWMRKGSGELSSIPAWNGYAFTQNREQDTKFKVTAEPILEDKTITFTCTSSGMQGDNLFVNSYLAPIDVTKIDKDDIVDPNNKLTRTFFVFNSGSWNDWNSGSGDITTGDYDQSSAGHYYSIPFFSAKLIDDGKSQVVLPSMQGVYVYSEAETSITFKYDKHIFNTTAKNLHHPMRAPQKQFDEDFRRVRIHIGSQNSGADRMYLVQEKSTTPGYDNGYDGDNILANGQVNIYTNEPFGQMEVSCSNNIDSMLIGFTTGADTEYTLTFGAVVGTEMYLKDIELDQLIPIIDGEQYTFYASPNTTNNTRFQLLVAPDLSSDTPGQEGGVATDVDNITTSQFWVSDKQVYVLSAPANSTLQVYSISGMPISTPYTLHSTPYTLDLSHLPTGVYVIRLNDQVCKFVCE